MLSQLSGDDVSADDGNLNELLDEFDELQGNETEKFECDR